MPAIWMLVVALAGGDWQCEEEAGMWQCRARPVEAIPPPPAPAQEPVPPPVAEPEAETETEPEPAESADPPAVVLPVEPSPPPQPVAVDDPYIVQVGAYRKRETAERAADALALPGLSIVPTRRDDEDWFVLLLGAYPSWEDADRAGRDFGGSFWVRRSSDLRQVLRE